ncbi:conserved hypothetical protein [Methylocella silvestris BL2]|uniref:Uncharacterized protein n=1 Tax=Methylocella silvestris (strain DSM 15510 / CIP 108128 / LMG 27833 / NCIMB 13906 / BL2) TaxID=395965 RepID=B8ER94_METSB|nr:hypothetical protein [Methylocella silvestris]ACK50278.1 conserved hypothetical protein [Methylocella silvestris BL2]
MPEHVKFLLRHALIGIAIGLCAVIAIVTLDVAHIGTLIGRSSQKWLWLTLLAASFSFSFGGLQMAFAIMLIPNDEE